MEDKCYNQSDARKWSINLENDTIKTSDSRVAHLESLRRC